MLVDVQRGHVVPYQNAVAQPPLEDFRADLGGRLPFGAVQVPELQAQ